MDTPFAGVKAFAECARDNLMITHDDMVIEAQVHQTHYANQGHQEEPTLRVGDMVYLATKNLSFPKGRARKLVLKFIGPYKITEAHPEVSGYMLDLPQNLREHWIHPTFHVDLFRKHKANNVLLFPQREARVFYDMGIDNDQEWMVDKIVDHRWTGKKLELLVRWMHNDMTWESYKKCSKLSAMDEYLALNRVQKWQVLPKNSNHDTS